MSRSIGWFSSGAASAVAIKIFNPDIIVFCDTGSEDLDNKRFFKECEAWFGRKITVIKSRKYSDTWDVWKRKRYISNLKGAPCTRELKIKPRLEFEKPGDVHIFGYTNDKADMTRAKALREHFPDLTIVTPLIEKQITKQGCLSLIKNAEIPPPRVYEMGFPNANCIPCCKAQSPAYWALIRECFPREFKRMARLSRELGARLAVLSGIRIFIDQIPLNHPVTEPIAPMCDMLCHLADQEINEQKYLLSE